jgi:hypothetical protein
MDTNGDNLQQLREVVVENGDGGGVLGVNGDVDATVFRLRGDVYDVQHSRLREACS